MIPLFTSKQVREADQYAINSLKIPGMVLMENASLNIFRAMKERIENFGPEVKVGIVCGKGNNGGDGFALARHLLNNGNNVEIICLSKKSEYRGDALANLIITEKLSGKLKRGRITGFKNVKDLSRLKNCGIIVDAILGTGASGGLREPLISIINKLNDLDAVKVAIDVPTGLFCDTGGAEHIFSADITVTLAELKRGLFIEKGYSNCGLIVKGGIGIGDEYFNTLIPEDYLIQKSDALQFIPRKEADIHKYSAGKVFTIAGSVDLPGAAILTAKAALNSGAGASVLAVPGSVKSIAQTKMDSAIVISPENSDDYFSISDLPFIEKRVDWADVTAIGPGIGRSEETIEAVVHLLSKRRSEYFIIDADALYALQDVKLRKMDLRNFVFTPHHQEFADLIHISLQELKSDILKIGKNFAKRHSTILVLKGAPTIVFSPEGEAFINSSGNAGMAKFGSGDVLTGTIAGFVAQNKTLLDSVISAVFVHSYSADLLLEEGSVHGVTAEKILENIPKTILRLESEVV